MATAEQAKALLRSYSEGEGNHFVSVALQIAADAARSGKEKLAHQLRDLVDEIKREQAAGQVGGAVPIARPQGELAGLLAVSYPGTRLSEMALSAQTYRPLERVNSRIPQSGSAARTWLVGPPEAASDWAPLGQFGGLVGERIRRNRTPPNPPIPSHRSLIRRMIGDR